MATHIRQNLNHHKIQNTEQEKMKEEYLAEPEDEDAGWPSFCNLTMNSLDVNGNAPAV